MANGRRQRALLGLFVLTALLILAGLVVVFGGLPSYFTPHVTYTLVFDDAPGVSVGTPVRRSGVRLGEATAVELDPVTDKVKVQVQLNPKYPPKANEEAIIVQGLLTSDTTIDFIPKQAPPNQAVDRNPLPPGSELAGHPAVDTRTLLAQASAVLPSAQQSLDQIRKSAERFEQVAAPLEQTVRELGDLARSGREVVPEVRKTNDRLQKLLDRPQGLGDELKRTNDELQATARTFNELGERLNVLVRSNERKLEKALDQLNDVLDRTGKVLSDENQQNVTATLRNLRTASERLDPTLKSADDFLKEGRTTAEKAGKASDQVTEVANQAEGMLKELRPTTAALTERGPRIVRNVDESSEQLTKTLAQLNELLRAFGRSDGTVARLLNDPVLYNNFADTLTMVNRLLPRIDRILKDVEVFADKIARHPELLGARGAIAPSAGIKEAPPPYTTPRPHLLPGRD